jgi:hypothetical protein
MPITNASLIDGEVEADQPNPAQATNSYWGKALGDAVRNGTISEARLDDMVSFNLIAFIYIWKRTVLCYHSLGDTSDGSILQARAGQRLSCSQVSAFVPHFIIISALQLTRNAASTTSLKTRITTERS